MCFSLYDQISKFLPGNMERRTFWIKRRAWIKTREAYKSIVYSREPSETMALEGIEGE